LKKQQIKKQTQESVAIKANRRPRRATSCRGATPAGCRPPPRRRPAQVPTEQRLFTPRGDGDGGGGGRMGRGICGLVATPRHPATSPRFSEPVR